jgi:very-short-patch-repair endonuclease
MDREIIYYYQRGVASYLIAKKYKISNTKVRLILEKNGIKLRSHDVTNQTSADRRTPEENRAITQKATKSNIGSTHTNLHRTRLAISRQKNPKIDPVYEEPLVRLCKEQSIPVVPQKAFYKFNVDLYLVKEKVVLEIFGGGFHNKEDAVRMFQSKMDYLSSNNIPVVIVWADRLMFNPQAVIEVAMRAKERLTIIDGSGSPSMRGLSDIIIT